ncbi:glycosyl transferase-like sugar-binding protein [Humitalea rosea]|uniref:Glycosyl transferase-like sugar-binding protein n=1 Tax=Humitalea rosea TaxID=990373 RepID=A0A2W7ITK2_9PROT|nr:glycosyltransferase [Humitalea rosea]PZW49203.1 glycosyl transferase-like sugar-binding protein [Humitalea rosea]
MGRLDPPVPLPRDAPLSAPPAMAAGDPAPHVARGHLLCRRQRFRSAEAAFRQALALGSRDATILEGMAQIASAGGAFHLAALAFEAAAKRMGPRREPLLAMAAAAYTKLGWQDAALARLAGLARPLPAWWAAIENRASALKAAQDRRIRHLLPLARQGSLNAGAGRELLLGLVTTGRMRAAPRLAQRLREVFPDDPGLAEAEAEVALRSHGPEAALALLERGPGRADTRPEAAGLAARLSMEAGDPVAAAAVLDALPRELWTAATWTQACRLRSVAEDGPGLIALARAWMRRPNRAFDSTAACFLLDGLLLAGRVALLEPAGTEHLPGPGCGVMQFWDSPVPPADVAEVMASWARMNPGLPHTVLDLARARAFIAAEHGEAALRCFDGCRHAAMKSDYLRLLWLFTHGGLYADSDDRCIAPVAPLLDALRRSEVVVVLATLSPAYLNNCLIGARPRSAILGAAIAEVTARLREADGAAIDIWNGTGPGLLTRHVVAALAEAATPEAARAAATVLRAEQLQAFTRNEPGLAYKMTPAGNWRLA